MKGLFAILLTVSLILCASCAHSSISPLIGGDRDEHGCIGSAGYTWSYALHDCVRLWEAGTSFDAGPERVYLIFSPDSTYAEIFGSKDKSVLCRRIKGTDIWKPRKGKESVSIQNGVTCVKINNYTYTK